MTIFTMEYRKEGYSLADAFRPDPLWGRRVFTISAADAGTSDIEEIRKLAEATKPVGYKLHGVAAISHAIA